MRALPATTIFAPRLSTAHPWPDELGAAGNGKLQLSSMWSPPPVSRRARQQPAALLSGAGSAAGTPLNGGFRRRPPGV